MQSRKLAPSAVLLLSLACLSSQYAPESASGGYSQTKLNDTTYEIRFQANGFTRVDRAGALLLRRGAELTLENGHRYFVISDQRSVLRGEDPAVIATLRILDVPAEGAVDAVVVIHDTDATAGGKLSEKAREQLRKLEAGAS